MGKSRLVLHPILGNKRSRFVLYIFLAIALITGLLAWVKFSIAVRQAGLSLIYGPPSKNLLLSFLLSVYVRMGLIFIAAIVATGITAHHIIGPINRMKQWLMDLENGHKMSPLRVRMKDKFTKFVDQINQLFEIH